MNLAQRASKSGMTCVDLGAPSAPAPPGTAAAHTFDTTVAVGASDVLNWCHQCKERKRVSQCTNEHPRCRRRYCEACLRTNYGERIADVLRLSTWACPCCRSLCVCAACKRRKDALVASTLAAARALRQQEGVTPADGLDYRPPPLPLPPPRKPTLRMPYNCAKCGLPKQGHVCVGARTPRLDGLAGAELSSGGERRTGAAQSAAPWSPPRAEPPAQPSRDTLAHDRAFSPGARAGELARLMLDAHPAPVAAALLGTCVSGAAAVSALYAELQRQLTRYVPPGGGAACGNGGRAGRADGMVLDGAIAAEADCVGGERASATPRKRPRTATQLAPTGAAAS